MTKTVSAVALRAFTHADDSFAKDQVIAIDPGHFADWSAEGVGLVREATDEDAVPAQASADEQADDKLDADG